jgi:hypothetical protein
MLTDQAYKQFQNIKTYYDSIKNPKFRNVNIEVFREKYKILVGLKNDLGQNSDYLKLVNAMSQIISRFEKHEALAKLPDDKIWSNLSERGMNKAIPPIIKSKDQIFPVEWKDKWGYNCYVSNGYWNAKNYRVMDALGYMFLLKQGGDCLPEKPNPIFDDLFEVEQRELQLNNEQSQIIFQGNKHSIGFTDEDFRNFTGFRMSSSDILALLLETSRVEFKLTFPVRLKSAGKKDSIHPMNYFSRFFELAYEDVIVRSDGIVKKRGYRVIFNTLLGELFINNLLARYNDRIDMKFYLLLDSAQVFYRRALLHHNHPKTEIHLIKIAELVGLKDSNISNLSKTVERNILEPLKDNGYIESYEKTEGANGIKYIITRSDTTGNKEVG